MFRLDRFLTLNFFHPLVKRKSLSENYGIPVLMYHSISNGKSPVCRHHPYFETNTTPEIFDQQISWLKENNYHPLYLDQAVRQLKNRDNRKRMVCITFDDGFRDFYDMAFPILKKHGFTASMFLSTKFVDNQQVRLHGSPVLNWGQVRELAKQGIRFGSHSVTHGKLESMGQKALEFELQHSKNRIENETSERVKSFSYPFALPEVNSHFMNRLERLLSKLDYAQGVSTKVGMATPKDNIYFLKRLPINKYDDISLFKAKLEGAYDWLYPLQKSFKLLKTMKAST